MKCSLCKSAGTEEVIKVVCGRLASYPVCIRCKSTLEKMLEDGVILKESKEKAK